VKTYKCTILVKLQVASGALGMRAAKVSEVPQLSQAGLKYTDHPTCGYRVDI